MAKALHWHGLLEVAVRQADLASRSSTSTGSHAVASVATELKKLAELRDSGILTEEEFQKQKQKLIG
jgi:hypothetical protein